MWWTESPYDVTNYHRRLLSLLQVLLVNHNSLSTIFWPTFIVPPICSLTKERELFLPNNLNHFQLTSWEVPKNCHVMSHYCTISFELWFGGACGKSGHCMKVVMEEWSSSVQVSFFFVKNMMFSIHTAFVYVGGESFRQQIYTEAAKRSEKGAA